MKPQFLTSACRYCRHYQSEGRRGGMCQMLGGKVQGSWKACALVLPTFAPSWEYLEEMMLLPDKTPLLSNACTLNSEVNSEENLGLPSEPKKLPLLV